MHEYMCACMVFRIGSSIVVSSARSLLGFTRLIGNPQCFILYEHTSTVPSEWDDVSVCMVYHTTLPGFVIADKNKCRR